MSPNEPSLDFYSPTRLLRHVGGVRAVAPALAHLLGAIARVRVPEMAAGAVWAPHAHGSARLHFPLLHHLRIVLGVGEQTHAGRVHAADRAVRAGAHGVHRHALLDCIRILLLRRGARPRPRPRVSQHTPHAARCRARRWTVTRKSSPARCCSARWGSSSRAPPSSATMQSSQHPRYSSSSSRYRSARPFYACRASSLFHFSEIDNADDDSNGLIDNFR